ncbi:hypothetical protein [Nocardioides pantholopis]|uniref:hypothetical protein n=1 Tax=Nocardioides pantholopis TaxID=2483798 RepID=UPI000FD88632|nr:hypothetical protein [Nocardioides pantholopis]
MRLPRTAALVGVALLVGAVGPVVLVAALALLGSRRVRDWLRPTWRVVAGWTVAVVALAGLVIVVPDGWLPIPPGPGAAVTPAYVGRAARAQPIEMAVPQHPHLAANGRSGRHNDAWSSGAYAGPGPLGDSVEVDSAWFGMRACATVAVDAHDRLVVLCEGRAAATLRVLDAETMRPLATKDLPGRPEGDGPAAQSPCGRSAFYLDDRDRAVVATTDRRVLVVRTDDADGAADLTTDLAHDLSAHVPADDCLVALLPDWGGRIWWASRDGRVGAISAGGPGGTGGAEVTDLGEPITGSLSADRDGGVFVATTAALYKLAADPAERPSVRWRAPRGGGERPDGPLAGDPAPTILPGGVLAGTDHGGGRLQVVFRRTGDGSEVCRATVFDEGSAATRSALVAVGGGVVVENNHGYGGPVRTLLGRTTSPGLARVDHRDGACTVAWTSPEVAPSAAAKVSLATGLLYTWTKPRSWWGVDAWYLTAIDARTGRTRFSVRAGLGALRDNHGAAVTLGPDGSAYVATLGGMVRVRDKR